MYFGGQIKPEFPVWSTQKTKHWAPSALSIISSGGQREALYTCTPISGENKITITSNSWILGWFRVSMRSEGLHGDRRRSHRLTSTLTGEQCRQGSGRPVRRIPVPSEQSRHHLWAGYSDQSRSDRLGQRGKKKPVGRGKTILQW